MKNFLKFGCLGSLVLFVIVFIIALLATPTDEKIPVTAELLQYELVNKDVNDAGILSLTIDVDTDNVEKVRDLANYIMANPYSATGYNQSKVEIESIYMQFYNKEDKKVWVNARVGLSNKGVAQTGTQGIGELLFEENK